MRNSMQFIILSYLGVIMARGMTNDIMQGIVMAIAVLHIITAISYSVKELKETR